ncbi:hypothetical protein RCL1_003960 [Eukaryota sp. TZLM3-RCL]
MFTTPPIKLTRTSESALQSSSAIQLFPMLNQESISSPAVASRTVETASWEPRNGFQKKEISLFYSSYKGSSTFFYEDVVDIFFDVPNITVDDLRDFLIPHWKEQCGLKNKAYDDEAVFIVAGRKNNTAPNFKFGDQFRTSVLRKWLNELNSLSFRLVPLTNKESFEQLDRRAKESEMKRISVTSLQCLHPNVAFTT